MDVLNPSHRHVFSGEKWNKFGVRPKYFRRYDVSTKVVYLGDARPELKYLENVLGRTSILRTPVITVNFDDAVSEFAPAVDLPAKEQGIRNLDQKNSELCRFVEQHGPHRQLLKTALAFLVFFSGVLTVQLFLGTWLISSALAWAGIAVSASAVLLSYLAALDWRDWTSQRNASH